MSICSMKNKRQIEKDSTRSLIVEKTLELITKQGIVDTSTKQISEYCKLAHGTLFAHFGTRDKLIAEVVSSELKRIARQIHRLHDEGSSLEQILETYLSLIAGEEDLFVILVKEFSFFDISIRQEIIATETIIKKYVFEKIEEGIRDKIYKPLDITKVLSFLFGTINYYLQRKEFFVSSGSVIESRKEDIHSTFFSLIKL